MIEITEQTIVAAAEDCVVRCFVAEVVGRCIVERSA
jgi:hypothetical protein